MAPPPRLHAAAPPRRLLRCGSGEYRLRPRLQISGAFQRLVPRAEDARDEVFTTCAAPTRAMPRTFFDAYEIVRPCAMKFYSNGRPVMAASSRTTRSDG